MRTARASRGRSTSISCHLGRQDDRLRRLMQGDFDKPEAPLVPGATGHASAENRHRLFELIDRKRLQGMSGTSWCLCHRLFCAP